MAAVQSRSVVPVAGTVYSSDYQYKGQPFYKLTPENNYMTRYSKKAHSHQKPSQGDGGPRSLTPVETTEGLRAPEKIRKNGLPTYTEYQVSYGIPKAQYYLKAHQYDSYQPYTLTDNNYFGFGHSIDRSRDRKRKRAIQVAPEDVTVKTAAVAYVAQNEPAYANKENQPTTAPPVVTKEQAYMANTEEPVRQQPPNRELLYEPQTPRRLPPLPAPVPVLIPKDPGRPHSAPSKVRYPELRMGCIVNAGYFTNHTRASRPGYGYAGYEYTSLYEYKYVTDYKPHYYKSSYQYKAHEYNHLHEYPPYRRKYVPPPVGVFPAAVVAEKPKEEPKEKKKRKEKKKETDDQRQRDERAITDQHEEVKVSVWCHLLVKLTRY